MPLENEKIEVAEEKRNRDAKRRGVIKNPAGCEFGAEPADGSPTDELHE